MKKLFYSILAIFLYFCSQYADNAESYHNFYFRDAGDITTGVFNNNRVDSSSVTKQGNNFNGPNQLLQLDSGGKISIAVTTLSFVQNSSTLQAGTTIYITTGTILDLFSSSFSVVSGTTVYRFRPDTQATMGSGQMLAIDNNNSSNTGLKTYFADTPGGQRLYLWDPTQNLPNVPHTGIKPTFAVYGDIMVGDIVAIKSNPMTYFIRSSTGLAPTAITQIFSSSAGAQDVNGGAGLTLAPSSNSAASDGYLSLDSFGQGSGTYSNGIRLQRRTGVNTVGVTGYWDTNGNYIPGTSATYDFGSSSSRLKNIFTSTLSVNGAQYITSNLTGLGGDPGSFHLWFSTGTIGASAYIVLTPNSPCSIEWATAGELNNTGITGLGIELGSYTLNANNYTVKNTDVANVRNFSTMVVCR